MSKGLVFLKMPLMSLISLHYLGPPILFERVHSPFGLLCLLSLILFCMPFTKSLFSSHHIQPLADWDYALEWGFPQQLVEYLTIVITRSMWIKLCLKHDTQLLHIEPFVAWGNQRAFFQRE